MHSFLLVEVKTEILSLLCSLLRDTCIFPVAGLQSLVVFLFLEHVYCSEAFKKTNQKVINDEVLRTAFFLKRCKVVPIPIVNKKLLLFSDVAAVHSNHTDW